MNLDYTNFQKEENIYDQSVSSSEEPIEPQQLPPSPRKRFYSKLIISKILPLVIALILGILLGVGILLLFSHSPISQPLTTQDVAMLSEEISYQYVPLYSGSDRTNVQASVQTTSNTYGENGKVTKYICGLQDDEGNSASFSSLYGTDLNGDKVVDVLSFSYSYAPYSDYEDQDISREILLNLIETHTHIDPNTLWPSESNTPNWELSDPVPTDIYYSTSHVLMKSGQDGCVLLYETSANTSQMVVQIYLNPGLLLTKKNISAFAP